MVRRVVFPLALLSAACVEEASVPTLPEQALPLRITASAGQLGPAEAITFRVTLTNPFDEVVRLAFPTSCQMLVFVRTAGGRVVTPENGTYQCAAVPSLLTIRANDSVSTMVTWRGGSEFVPPGSVTRLPAGHIRHCGDSCRRLYRPRLPDSRHPARITPFNTADAQALRPAVIARYTACRAGAGSHIEKAAVLRTVPLVDGHNDLPWYIRTTSGAPRDVEAYDLRRPTSGNTDIARLRRGMVGASSGPSTFPGTIGTQDSLACELEQIDIAKRVMAKYRRCSSRR